MRILENSSFDTLSFLAISSSVATLPSSISSFFRAPSTWLDRDRTSRGTQSMARSSSRIAPRMRGAQYVSNFTPRSMSKPSMAYMSPKIAGRLARSSTSTSSGSFVWMRSAWYFTSGR